MSRPHIWTSDVEDVLAEIWASDAAAEHLPRILEARTGLAFTYGAMLSRARKLGFGMAGRPKGLSEARVARTVERFLAWSPPTPDRVRLVAPGSFPAKGYTMLRSAR